MKNRISKIILWIARIWGGLSFLFLLFMVGAHLIGALSGEVEGSGMTAREFATFIFFPLSTIVGLGIAFKWPNIGGTITIIGAVGFLFMRPDLISDPMIYQHAGPGLLFLAYWFLKKSS